MKKELKKTIALVSVSAIVAIVITLGLYNRASNKITKVETEPVNTHTTSNSTPDDRIDLTPANENVTLSTKAEISDQNIANAIEPIAEAKVDISTEDAIPEYTGQGDVGYTFSEAFKDARADLGPGRFFIWNGLKYTTTFASELAAEDKAILAAADSASKDSIEDSDVPDDSAARPEVSIPVSEEVLLSTSVGTNSSGASVGGK